MIRVSICAIACAGVLLSGVWYRSVPLHAQAAQSSAATVISPGASMDLAVRTLANATLMTMGFEGRANGTGVVGLSAPLDVRGMSLDAALNAITQGSDYRWDRIDGVPVVRPVANENRMAALNRRIERIRFENVTLPQAVDRAVEAVTPASNAQPTAPGLLELLSTQSPTRAQGSMAVRFSLEAQDVTMAQMLSRIVAAHGGSGWTVMPERDRGQAIALLDIFTFDGARFGMRLPPAP